MRDFHDGEEYLIEAFEEYLEKCPCKDKEDCECMSFEKFRDNLMQEMEARWIESWVDDREEYFA